LNKPVKFANVELRGGVDELFWIAENISRGGGMQTGSSLSSFPEGESHFEQCGKWNKKKFRRGGWGGGVEQSNREPTFDL
jgi:hypothetical protein